MLGLREPGQPGIDRRTELLDARLERAGERRGGTERGIQRTERGVGVMQQLREQSDGRGQVLLASCEGRHRRVERRHEARQLCRLGGECTEDPRVSHHHAGKVVPLSPEQGLVDDRGVSQCVGGVLQRVVQRLSAGQPRHAGILAGVLRRAAGRVERPAESLKQRLQVRSRIRRERSENAIELNRPRRIGGGEGRTRGEDRRTRRSGVQIDVEVALEKQARANLRRRVSVDWQPAVLDVHRDDRSGGGLGKAVDRDDLPHIDAGDPDRGRNVEVRLGREHPLERERRAGEW